MGLSIFISASMKFTYFSLFNCFNCKIICENLEKYETLARKKCGNSNDGWTYPQIKGCEERHAEICKKHPNLNYCPLTKKMRKSDFYIYDKLTNGDGEITMSEIKKLLNC